jgi:hypothetical protein
LERIHAAAGQFLMWVIHQPTAVAAVR